MRISEPLLAAKFNPDNSRELAMVKSHLPLYASFKLDGVRAVVQDGKVLSRSMKLIPNGFVQHILSGTKGVGDLDGELIVGDPTDPLCYNKTVSAVMRKDGEPDFKFYVFDYVAHPASPFHLRKAATPLPKHYAFVRVEQKLCTDWQDVLDYEELALGLGYEGLILRAQTGLYKEGRSTLKEGYAIKLKRFTDAEAEVTGFVELQRNLNEQTINEVGRLKRSSHKENKVGGGTMGAIQVRDLKTGVEFEIGTGFTAEQRQEWWDARDSLLGILIKYKSFPVGVKDKPRHPVFLGIRDRRDTSHG